MIEFGREVCGDLGSALSREWLETNGLGGFASSTIAGLNTRRYHGLLIAATQPPVGRMLLLSKVEETLILGDQRFELSANQYPSAVHPQGYRFLKHFRLDPFPIFTYEVEGVEMEKSVFMVQGENTTVVEYRITRGAARECRLELRPLIAFRDYHSTTHENSALNPAVATEPGLATIAPYAGLLALHLAHNAASLDATGFWFRNFEYAAERERGLDFTEDLFSPCVLLFDLGARQPATVVASTERRAAANAAAYRSAEGARRQAIRAAAPAKNPLVEDLAAAADQYIVARGEHKTVIAGYPWFSDWGRDTMISLPGLTLVTGRFDVARDILLAFAQSADQGMLPNRFPDASEQPEYNTVDATLWFFEAVRSYLAYTGDYDFVRKNLFAVLTDILAWHFRGTRYGIKVDPSGLLASGEPGVQLTWMDAKIGNWVVTPRRDKPVEIQALWYNALCVMEDLAAKFGDHAGETRYKAAAAMARWSFHRLFWNEPAGCLYDVVNGGPPDASLRPNQILAVSLHHSMLSPERARSVVEVVERELLTPFGLRTLPQSDPRYVPRYRGDQRSRDSSYHQGTVWPWLMGPFIAAYRKVYPPRTARPKLAAWLESFVQHLNEAGLGQVSEIFDADPPHTARGCFAQAWSVAELLRAACEDVYATAARPRKAGAATAPTAATREITAR
ncbi:MAG: amylo-alpha-1,6-glucosidase [Terriglobales bacterium]